MAGDRKELRKRLVALWLEGKTIAEIAKAIGLAESNVGMMIRDLRKRGVALPGRPRGARVTDAEISELKAMVDDATTAEAAPDSAG